MYQSPHCCRPITVSCSAVLMCPLTFHLFFGASSCQPLSAEAVEPFGPMHIPVATKGHENPFVALANRKRVDGSTLCSSAGCIRCSSTMEYLIYILAQHSPRSGMNSPLVLHMLGIIHLLESS